MRTLDNLILAVTAQPAEDEQIRLKYLAISGGTGPELTMDRKMALQTIRALQTALNGQKYDSDQNR